MTSTPADEALSRVRAICFDFGGVEEKLSHGAPFFHVRGKGFAIFSGDHRGERAAAWCRASLDEQQRLVRSDGARYFVPPYVGVKGWVGVRLREDADFDALALVVEEAWLGVVPRSLQGAAPKAPKASPRYPTTDPAVAQEALRRLTEVCDALPGTVVEEERGHATFRVGKRPYAYLLDNHHRDGIVSVCVRHDDPAGLAASSPKRFYVPAYIGPKGWVAMRVDVGRVPWTKLAEMVRASHAGIGAARRG
ncbi:MAG: MmcQ/YjbR family DNA-binding protein [Polyangiales bacterium]